MKTVIILLCVLVLDWQAKAESSEKKYQKTFSREGIEELVVSNTYGKMEISQIETTEIKVEVIMRVCAKSGAKADETLELIQIKEVQNDCYLNLETMYGKDMGLKQFLNGITISVDYKVSLPRGIKLRLISTKGNIYLGNFAGELNVDLKEGDFKGTVIKEGEFHIQQDKGIFTVEDVAWLNGDFKNTTVQIGSGDDVRLTLNACDGYIESAGKLNVRSSGGTMKLGDVEELIGSSSFTKYEIQDLGNVLDMDMKMGEMNIRNVQLLFSEIWLKGSFTKVGLTFMQDAGYQLEIRHNKSLKMNLPQGMELEKKSTAERNTTVSSEFVGNPKYTGKVLLELSNGSLYIQ